jgi:hypothetical protein
MRHIFVNSTTLSAFFSTYLTKGKLPPHNEKLLPPCLDYTISFIADWAKSPAAFTRIRVAFPGIYAKGTSSNFRVIFYYASRNSSLVKTNQSFCNIGISMYFLLDPDSRFTVQKPFCLYFQKNKKSIYH